jgi:hypothetical protein
MSGDSGEVSMGMRWQDWMHALLGVWLLAAPFLMNYSGSAGGVATRNSVAVGVALIVVALVGVLKRLPRRRWLALGLGVWLILSPFVLGYAGAEAAAWNAIITGIVMTVAAGAAVRAIGKGPRGA